MTYLVITRGGFGDIWSHKNKIEAFNHPVSQFGDAYFDSVYELLENYYTVDQLIKLCEISRATEILETLNASNKLAKDMKEQIGRRLLDHLVKVSKPAPIDSEEIVRILVNDRKLGTITIKQESNMAKKHQEVENHDEAVAKKPVRQTNAYHDDKVIHLLHDKQDVQYGEGNNPKKVGSKSHEAFAKYKHGMTIADAKAAGLESKDFAYDLSKGFISLN